MSEQQPEDQTESGPGDIGDDQLPEDLQPNEDNPLARHPGQTGDDDDKIGAGTEGGGAENPSTNITYGSGPDDNDAEDSAEDRDAEDRDAEDTPDAEEDDGSSTLDNGGGGAG